MAEDQKDLVRSESRPMMSMRDFDRWFDEILPRPLTPFFPRIRISAEEEMMPNIDMYESNGDIVLKAELPGMKKEDIDITLSEGMITISGEKKKDEEIKRKDYYKLERSYGSFCRSFSLPAEVKSDKVKSSFKDGILEVHMPKSEKAKSKEVKVKVE